MNNCLKLIANIQETSGIVQGLTLSVNSIIFIIIGSIIATIGLLYNSYSIILGSMLISPIGNSIVRYSLGYTYNYLPFISQGVTSLIAQIIVSITIGYVIGLVNKESGNIFSVPTNEMETRTDTKYYITDYTISLLCGFILAYSLINNQRSPIVGLSLAISILPPLVNSGLYAAIAHTSKDMKEYNKNMKNALKTFVLAILNIIGITFTCVIGFYVFCSRK